MLASHTRQCLSRLFFRRLARSAWTPLAVLLGVSACGSSDEQQPNPAPERPVLPTGGCGTAAYSLLPFEGMGRIVDWQYMVALSVNADFINAGLEQEGIKGFSPVPYGVSVYRIRYVTQDKGKEVEATGLISYPAVSDAQSFPTVLWTHPTAGFTDACAPSANGFDGALGNMLLSSQGYVVVAPDYLGMNGMGAPAGFLHPYLQAEATAIASLDALRALQRFENGEGDPGLLVRHDGKTVIWGASEGGFAALWADRYWKGYAPDFDLVATVAVVPPTDLLALNRAAVDKYRPATGALAAALLTLNQWHGDEAHLGDVITDEAPYNLASKLPQIVASKCDDGGAFDGITQVDQVYRQSYIDAVLAGNWDAIEPWACYLRLGTLNRTKIERGHDTPVFFVVAGADDLVVADTQRQDFPVLCSQGYHMEYYECAGASHVDGAANSLPAQLQWVQKRLAGQPMGDDVCQLTTPVACASLTGGP